MKLEELTKLGIAEETAKQVVAMNDAELADEKKKLTDKEAELTMATEKIKELSETVKKFDGVDVDKLKGDLAAAEKKYSEDIAAMKLDGAIAEALSGCGKTEKIPLLRSNGIIFKNNDGKMTFFCVCSPRTT